MTHTPTSADAVPAPLQHYPLARAAAGVCCTDAHWVYLHHNDLMVRAKCAADPQYAATIQQYLPLGGYIATGVQPE